MAVRSLRTVIPFLVGLASFAAIAVFDHARDFDLWRNYALSGFFLGIPVVWVLWAYDTRLPHSMQWAIVAGLLLHYGGGSMGSPRPGEPGLFGMSGINGAYHTIPWWDHLTHGVGIGAGAMASAYMFEAYQVRRGLGWSGWQVGGNALLAGLAAGVGVELYEYLGKSLFQTIDQGGYDNTMEDLLYNLLGAVIGATGGVAVNGRLEARIRSRWSRTVQRGRTRPTRRGEVPAAMRGFQVFMAVPAAASLLANLWYLAGPQPQDQLAAYDIVLRALAASAGVAVVTWPLATWLSRTRAASRTDAP